MTIKLRAERYAKDASPSLPAFITERLHYLDFNEAMAFYRQAMDKMKGADWALLGCNDRFFLLTGLCNRPDMIHPWQYERARELDAQPDGFLDLWARGHGKAVDVEEPVPTPDGWKKHGDLAPGDAVYGPDGMPTRVVAKTPVFTDAACFKVTFCDGYSVVVSAEHLWTVDLPDRSRINGTNQRKKWKRVTLSTRELKTHVDDAIRVLNRRYPTIPVAKPIQRPDADLPIDPYILGCWLGDGNANAAAMTTSWEDWPHFRREFEAAGHTVRVAYDRGNCLGYRVDSRNSRNTCIRGHDKTGRNGYLVPGTARIQCKACKANHQRHKKFGDVRTPRIRSKPELLRQIGLLSASFPLKKIEKHIPEQYLMASEAQRWALLQGLMDTDGHCHKDHAQCQFVSVIDRMADQVFDLCQSLGLKPTKRRQTVLYKGERRPFWQILFLGRADKPPFRLQRKIDRCTADWQIPYRKIKSVEPVPSQPVSCITVDREDGLYLIGKNYVTTHNSSWGSFAGVIQEVMCDPEIRIGIFGNTKDISRPFLRQIKDEFEGNDLLLRLYPDVLYENPRKEAPLWSVESGITVKRKGNPKEATIEAHGLIDAMPTGRHFPLLVFDDIITEKNVTNPEQIAKATERVSLADNLGIGNGTRKWFFGTRYHYGDSYGQLIDDRVVTPRLYPATDDGTLDGKPVLLTQEAWDEKKRAQRTTIAAQMLQNPIGGQENTFNMKWLKPFWVRPIMMNVYIMVDPSKGRSKTSDRTAMAVIGIDSNNNRYLLDGYCHRMPLSERWEKLRGLHKKWVNTAGVQSIRVGAERYGLQSDEEYFEEKMRETGYRFDIIELNWTGQVGRQSKQNRVERLEPDMRNGDFFVSGKVWHPEYPKGATWEWDDTQSKIEYAPIKGLLNIEKRCQANGELWRLIEPLRRVDEDGSIYDLTRVFFTEVGFFPFSPRDDLIDAVSRIYDMEPRPAVLQEKIVIEEYVDS